MARLPVLKATELIRVLERIGFVAVRQRGSHIRLKHGDGRVVTVTYARWEGYCPGAIAQDPS